MHRCSSAEAVLTSWHQLNAMRFPSDNEDCRSFEPIRPHVIITVIPEKDVKNSTFRHDLNVEATGICLSTAVRTNFRRMRP